MKNIGHIFGLFEKIEDIIFLIIFKKNCQLFYRSREAKSDDFVQKTI